MQRSMVSLGTCRPAFLAARRAMIWQMVTEMSASMPLRLVAPAALVVLRVDDQLHGGVELFAQLGPRGHAVALGQKHRGEAVAVHRPVADRAGLDDESALLGSWPAGNRPRGDLRAVRPPAGRAARGHQRHARQRRDRRVAPQAGRAEGAVVVLMRETRNSVPARSPSRPPA